MGRGAFIVLEGLDRTGKSTQTAKLVERIEKQGRACKLLKFPGTAAKGGVRLT
jgi:dTMP kinase